MRPDHRLTRLLASFTIFSTVIGCGESKPVSDIPPKVASKPSSSVVKVEPGPDATKLAQTALIKAKPGDVVEFGAGRFEFKSTLSLDASGVTIRGQGPEKTILSFKDQGQGTGGEGLSITSKGDVTVENLAVEDARGDAIKASGTRHLVFRNVRTEWTGGPKETNGGYGIYPVLCSDLLIEHCTAIGASDSGIYVGQSENIIVRRNSVRQNVAGIEIENSVGADVYENNATDNTGGILVFTMPDLPKKEGRRCRVYKNTVVKNNHENFAPKGNIVASVPPGTGVMIMASDEAEVFDNTISENQTAALSIVSYLISGKPIKDDKYDPFCDTIAVHGNTFQKNGENPSGGLGSVLSQVLGKPLPAILYDGVVDPRKLAGGKPGPNPAAISIRDNGDAGFANFDAAALPLPGSEPPAGKKPNIVRDTKPYSAALASLPAISIRGVQ